MVCAGAAGGRQLALGPPRTGQGGCGAQGGGKGAQGEYSCSRVGQAIVRHKQGRPGANNNSAAGALQRTNGCPRSTYVFLFTQNIMVALGSLPTRPPPSHPSPLQARLDAAAAAATAAFHVCPNLALLVEAMLAHPPEQWEERCPLQPGERVTGADRWHRQMERRQSLQSSSARPLQGGMPGTQTVPTKSNILTRAVS